MLQEIQDQVCLNIAGQIVRSIVKNRRQGAINGDDLNGKMVFGVTPDALYFPFSAAVLLEDQDFLSGGWLQ